MPFDYDDYKKKCDTLTTEQLHKEWDNYTRQLAGGATSTATSVLFSPLTAGISLVGLGLSAPRIHNARKKRDIIQAGLEARGETHNTRKRDVIAPMAIAGTLSTVTLGLAGPVANAAAGAVVEHGVEYAVSHAALDGAGAIAEHKHDEHSKKKTDQKLKIQYQRFQQQYVQEQRVNQGLQPQQNGYQAPVQQPLPEFKPPLSPRPQPTTLTQYGRQQGLPCVQFQPQAQEQEKKYDYVPIPAPHTSGPGRPVSHLPSYSQSLVADKGVYPLPQHPPIHHAIANPSNVPGPTSTIWPTDQKPLLADINTNSISRTESVQSMPSQVSGSPLQLNSPSPNSPLLEAETQILQISEKMEHMHIPSLHISMHELPGDTEIVSTASVIEAGVSVPLTMEQEIALLKAKILQMEIEKREGENETEAPTIGVSKPENPLTATISGPIQDMQYYPPTPCSPAPRPTSHIISPRDDYPSYQPPQSPPTQTYQVPAPPPPYLAPYQPSHDYTQQPPPIHSNTYNPQHYPPMPQPPGSPIVAQQQYTPTPPLPSPSPNVHRQQCPPSTNYQSYLSTSNPPRPHQQSYDSGYYSNPPTRTSSTISSMTSPPCYTPHSALSPQSTGTILSSHRYSISSTCPPSPLSPQPQQPYFPPPPPSARPASAYIGKQDHFGQQYQGPGTQGWQWGVPANGPGEPNYGPRPAVPQPWRGS